jgi:hypothetical protein
MTEVLRVPVPNLDPGRGFSFYFAEPPNIGTETICRNDFEKCEYRLNNDNRLRMFLDGMALAVWVSEPLRTNQWYKILPSEGIK